MSKKALTLISAILLIIFIVFSFMPCIFDRQFYKSNKYIYGAFTLYSQTPESLFTEVNFSLSVAIIILATIGCVSLFIKYHNYTIHPEKNKENILINLLSFSPIVSAFLLIILTIETFRFRNGNNYNYFQYDIFWGFYIECALLLLSCIFLCIAFFTKFQRNISTTNTENSPIESKTNELIKYKELLDNGVITQEEFDAKKKELLGTL